jgi:hypothetical protein
VHQYDLDLPTTLGIRALIAEYGRMRRLDGLTRRGQLFNDLIGDLLKVWGVERVQTNVVGVGEIDVAFDLSGTRYLLEAKWEQNAVDYGPISKLSGRMSQRLAGTRGVILSMAGYTADALRDMLRGQQPDILQCRAAKTSAAQLDRLAQPTSEDGSQYSLAHGHPRVSSGEPIPIAHGDSDLLRAGEILSSVTRAADTNTPTQQPCRQQRSVIDPALVQDAVEDLQYRREPLCPTSAAIGYLDLCSDPGGKIPVDRTRRHPRGQLAAHHIPQPGIFLVKILRRHWPDNDVVIVITHGQAVTSVVR